MNETERASSALNYLDAGCPREDWIRIGMAAKSAGLSFDDFHNWSQSGNNYKGKKECATAWNSFKETGGITSATLFAIAFAKGWKRPRKNGVNSKNSKNENQSFHRQQDKNAKPDAYNIWERCLPAESNHEYIIRKQGKTEGLRYYPFTEPALIINGKNVAGYLVIPCWSKDVIQTLQFIPPHESNKLNLVGASFNDGYFIVGTINSVIYVCEGLGQAWAINKATGDAAIVTFGIGRMMTISKVLRVEYFNARIIIVPDHGKEKQASEIAAAISGQWVEMPQEKPNNYDANDYAKEFGFDKLAQLLARVKPPEMRYKLLLGADLLNIPPMRWMLQGVIPAEGLAALYGESGSGKSFLILDMALSIAAGDATWFGLRVTKTPVTYVCLEGEAGIGKRIKAWSLYWNKLVPDKLRFVTQSFNLLSEDVTELANAITSAGGVGGLIIIDTLNRAAPGADENSSVDMGNIISSAQKLQNLTGGLVLLVHHTGKDKTKGLRGHSSLFAALDAAIEVIKNDNRRAWNIAKSKDDATGDSNPFKLEVVKVGFDDQGHEITSCVALFDNAKNIFQKKTSLSRNQKIALEELDKQLNNSPHFNEVGVPLSKARINYDEAILQVAKYMPTDSKHRKSRAISAIGGLIEKKYLGMKDDWLWRI